MTYGGGAISWSSKLQPFVSLSTTEAEYIAACEAGKEILWLRNLLTEFGYKVDSPSILKIDNQSALTVSKNPEHHGRMKHLDLRYFWLRETVELGKINPEYIPLLLGAMDDMELRVIEENEPYTDLINDARDLEDGEPFPRLYYGPLK